jgi:hypothetical protein
VCGTAIVAAPQGEFLFAKAADIAGDAVNVPSIFDAFSIFT